MTSQTLTSNARYTSSTVPTRLRQHHSIRDNEWRAIARAWIVEVQRSFHSHHSTCQSIANGAGAILKLYLSTPGRAHHGAQPWDRGYPCEQRLTEGRLGPLRPSRARDLGRAYYIPLLRSPNPRRLGGPNIATCDRAARARSRRPTSGRTKTRDYCRKFLAPGKELANMGARLERPERNC